MKWLISKALFVILSFLTISTATYSQDSTAVADKNGYEKRVERYYSFWKKLIPNYMKLQYAGSMGLISVGTGWDYGRNNQWETDVMLGIVPKYSTNKTKISFTLRQNFIPWNIKLGNKGFSLDPMACGLYVNTIFGHEFWTKEPERYPKGYYNFSTRLRFNVYLGQRLTFKIPEDRRIFAKSLTFYYEVSSSDLYIVSAATNSYLKPKDYLHLSLGLKVLLF
ncbi:MAG: hypothetical protein ACLVKO_09150 [Dysgonomonas sp.]